MRKRFIKIILLLGIAVFLGFLAYFVTNAETDRLVITLTDEGFKPNYLEINVGDTVTFKNKTDKLFWPAADIHPYHTDYKNFDPKRPLGKREVWTFTFDKIGKWGFHDHISPNNNGFIVVNSLEASVGNGCFDTANKDCWTNIITSVLIADGVEAAFAEVKNIHDNNPKFAAGCHNYVHDIGLKAYRLYGKDVELSEKTSYCNAGFFHGFMEGFIDDEPDPKKIDEFCTSVGNRVNDQFGLAEGHCRHGIGHGALEHELYDAAQVDSTPVELINSSMELCFATNNSEDSLMRCASGIYDTLRNWIYSNNPDEILELSKTLMDYCSQPKEEYIKRACYHELSKILSNLPNPDFKADVFDFKNEIAEEDYADFGSIAMRSFAINFGKLGVKEKTFEELIGFCRTADANLQQGCILGIFDGIQFSGTPGEEYKYSAKFCSSDLLIEGEKEACFHDYQEEVFYTYPEAVIIEGCSYVPEQFKTARCNLDLAS